MTTDDTSTNDTSTNDWSAGFGPTYNPNYVDVRKQNENVVANDPEGIAQVINDSAIYLWNPNAVNNTGLFPSRFASTVKNKDELLRLIRDDMSYSERLAFKQKLWAAGYYTPNRKAIGFDPTSDEQDPLNIRNDLTGNFQYGQNGDPDDSQAIERLFQDYVDVNADSGRTGAAIDLDSVFSDQLLTNAAQTREDMISRYDMQGLYLTMQDWSRKNLGRDLAETEMQKLFDQVFAFDQEPGAISGATQWNVASAEIDPLSRQQIVTGGGDNSSAINFGRGLASTYNLVVDASLNMNPKSIGATSEFEKAFTEGRAVKITGDLQRMIKLHEWANTQKRPDGVFENVRFVYDGTSNEPTGLLLSMNEGAKIPTMAASNFAYGQRSTDLDKFLDSVKRPGDVYAYSWEGEGPNRRGAYGLSDPIWEHYTNQLNIDAADTSITAQDRVARAYAADLYERYGSWKEVALAMRVHEDTANRRKAGREQQGEGFVDVVTDPTELAWADAAIAKMGTWTPVLDTKETEDLYKSMYGAGALYTPSNLFAGLPSTPQEAENKSRYMAEKVFKNELDMNDIMQMVMKRTGSTRLRTYNEWKGTQ